MESENRSRYLNDLPEMSRERSAASFLFFFQAEDGIRDYKVTGVQTCALPISFATLRAAMRQPLRKVVIPAAGLGTRFLPVTKTVPKEMLPIVDTPTIQLIVEEAVKAGAAGVILVTGRGKSSIEDHFDRSYELEDVLSRKNKTELLEQTRRIGQMVGLVRGRQKEPPRLGPAGLMAKPAVGEEWF